MHVKLSAYYWLQAKGHSCAAIILRRINYAVFTFFFQMETSNKVCFQVELSDTFIIFFFSNFSIGYNFKFNDEIKKVSIAALLINIR